MRLGFRVRGVGFGVYLGRGQKPYTTCAQLLVRLELFNIP